MSDEKMELWANSALLKLLQFFVTSIMIPLALWFMNGVLTRLEKIEGALNVYHTTQATTELRLVNIERQQAQDSIAIRKLSDRVITYDFRGDK